METRLVKILENEADVGKLNEENIAEYVQAKNAVESYKQLIVDPFETAAKESGRVQIFSAEGLEVVLKSRTTNQKLSAKEVVALFESYLQTVALNNANGKQMYGVRRFGEVIAIDADYLNNQFTEWQNLVLGQKETQTVGYKGERVGLIAENQAPRLTMLGYEPVTLRETDILLYIATSEQIKKIKKKIINPFEKAFKENAETNREKTVFDTRVFGGLAVQVKSVPRLEPDYCGTKEAIGNVLSQYAGLTENTVDNFNTFYNAGLKKPRPYAAIDTLMVNLETAKDIRVFKQRQEIRVLYMPQQAIVLSVD